MNGDDFKSGQEQGLILGELKALNGRMDELSHHFMDFKTGIGKRVESSELDLARVNERLSVVTTLGKWVISPVVGFLALAVLKLLIKP